MMGFCAKPGPMGLYDPAMDKDACGVGFIADTTKQDTRKTVKDALAMLVRMTHRGACGCEKNTGDGAGAASVLFARSLPVVWHTAETTGRVWPKARCTRCGEETARLSHLNTKY